MRKTESCCFHLNSKIANPELRVYVNGTPFTHNPTPKHLALNFKTLTFRRYLKQYSSKTNTKIEYLAQASRIKMGCICNPQPLLLRGRMQRSFVGHSRTKLIDVQINGFMHMTSGTMQSKPVYWPPVLCHIELRNIRGFLALLQVRNKITLWSFSYMRISRMRGNTRNPDNQLWSH